MKVIYIVSFYITFLYSQVDYQSDIQPIFNNNCIFCHQNGGSATLNLATYSGTMTGGGAYFDNFENFRKLQIWLFHGSEDGVHPATRS